MKNNGFSLTLREQVLLNRRKASHSCVPSRSKQKTARRGKLLLLRSLYKHLAKFRVCGAMVSIDVLGTSDVGSSPTTPTRLIIRDVRPLRKELLAGMDHPSCLLGASSNGQEIALSRRQYGFDPHSTLWLKLLGRGKKCQQPSVPRRVSHIHYCFLGLR